MDLKLVIWIFTTSTAVRTHVWRFCLNAQELLQKNKPALVDKHVTSLQFNAPMKEKRDNFCCYRYNMEHTREIIIPLLIIIKLPSWKLKISQKIIHVFLLKNSCQFTEHTIKYQCLLLFWVQLRVSWKKNTSLFRDVSRTLWNILDKMFCENS